MVSEAKLITRQNALRLLGETAAELGDHFLPMSGVLVAVDLDQGVACKPQCGEGVHTMARGYR